MNIDKVNATLLRAVNYFKEDEIEILRKAGKGGEDLKGIEAPLAKIAMKVSEQTGKPFAAALDKAVDIFSEAAARSFGSDVTEEQLIEWLGSESASALIPQIAEQL